MKKSKQKMEMRYYEVPRDEFIITLQGDSWKMNYRNASGALHFHNLLEIGVCRMGKGILKLENDTMEFGPGMISILPSKYPHETESEGDSLGFWEYIFVDVEKAISTMFQDEILLRDRMLNLINLRPIFEKADRYPELSHIVELIFSEMTEKPDMYKESVKGLTLSLIAHIGRINAGTNKATAPSIGVQGLDQIKPALEFIKVRYAEQVKIREVAAACHMSESHFRRQFKECLDMTPVEYLNQVRIHKSCNLIRNTNNSMEEIARKVGFTTISTFNRNFKRIVGTSPYQWKKQPQNYESKLMNFNIMVEKGW